MKERTARGTAIVNLLPLQPDEKIQAIIDTRDYETNRFLFFATKNGQVKKTKFTEYDSSLRDRPHRHQPEGRRRAGAGACQTNGETTSSWWPAAGQTIRFAEDDVRPMGRSGGRRAGHEAARRATRSCRATWPATTSTILIVTDAGYGKRTKLDKFNRPRAAAARASRASSSRPRRARWSRRSWSASTTRSFVIASGGIVIRMPVRDISSQGRDATGVRVMNLDEGQTVAAVAPVLAQDDESA